MFSKLIFGYGKLIMRIYFAQIVINIKIDFDFFIPSRVRIDHSGLFVTVKQIGDFLEIFFKKYD